MAEEMDKASRDAMTIIMLAGDAREACRGALDAVAADDADRVAECLAVADEKIAQAHKVQTDAIQGAVRGEEQRYSILFSHAQDTLMTVYSEISLAHELTKVFAAITSRIAALEATHGEQID